MGDKFPDALCRFYDAESFQHFCAHFLMLFEAFLF